MRWKRVDEPLPLEKVELSQRYQEVEHVHPVYDVRAAHVEVKSIRIVDVSVVLVEEAPVHRCLPIR